MRQSEYTVKLYALRVFKIPGDYSASPTCYACSGSDASGSHSKLLVQDGYVEHKTYLFEVRSKRATMTLLLIGLTENRVACSIISFIKLFSNERAPGSATKIVTLPWHQKDQ